VPRRRLTGEILAGQWGGSKKGSRSVAGHDEDVITMAAEAAMECLLERDPVEVDRLYLASTTAPYAEHQNAGMVAAVADLRKDIMAVDLGGSVRAGTLALRLAYDAVKADDSADVMVAAADMRPAKPGEPMERNSGDGAAALLVGREKPVAVFKHFYSTSAVFLDHWRKESDKYVSSGDPKFITDMGIMKHLPDLTEEFLEATDMAKEEIKKVVYYSPDLRVKKTLQKKLGFQAGAYLENDPQAVMGDVGNAQVFMGLLAALEQSEPGDKILMLNYGSGADACLLEVTEHIGNFKTSLGAQMEAGMPFPSYARYLRHRDSLPGEDINVWTSFPVLWREEKANVRRLGEKCSSCGQVNFPPRYKCISCGREEFDTVKVSRKGTVFTFTLDVLVPNPDSPTPMVSVDLDGGGRLYAQMTDVDPAEVKIGDRVEMVFRKLHQGGGYNNYFWKFRPLI